MSQPCEVCGLEATWLSGRAGFGHPVVVKGVRRTRALCAKHREAWGRFTSSDRMKEVRPLDYTKWQALFDQFVAEASRL